MKFPKNNSIDEWLDKNGDPEIESFIDKNLAITEKVRIAMENKGWKSQDLARAMDKNASELSKWLSGMHNLTLKSIIKMEIALGIDLIQVTPEKEYKDIYLGTVQNKEDLGNKVDDYQESTEQQVYEVAM
ncbi:MAG TPA: helix-turn-helix transcriptional regulator [Marinilabiliaceae bacterium]|nr:helix-turn-helix transcriptional regulator [Marinilabiliaceae bacterium]